MNRGGFANPDVLIVPTSRGDVVVKDYAPRASLVARWIAPALVRHELAMLRRAAGAPGVPEWGARVDRLALALQHVEGQVLRRRSLRAALPSSFFDALEGVLEALALRGLVHLDLRSPTNILLSETQAPVVVDLASAWALPLPAAFRRWIERRAIQKLRARFSAVPAPSAAESWRAPDPGPWAADLVVAGARWRRYEAGCLLDPVPVVLLPDLGVGGLSHAGALESAGRFGRRAIAIDLPGSGGSSQARAGWRVGRIARGLGELLDALRLRQIDLVAMGLGGVVARSFASIFPGRVRSLVTLDSPIRRLDPESARRLETARRRPRELAGLLASGLPQSLPEEVRRALVELLLAVGPSRLARPFRWLRVEDLGRGERGLARRSAPSRSTPWKALYSSPEHPGFAEANELAGVEARLVGDLASSEVLWSVLDEMSGLAGHDHGGSGTAPAHDRNVG